MPGTSHFLFLVADIGDDGSLVSVHLLPSLHWLLLEELTGWSISHATAKAGKQKHHLWFFQVPKRDPQAGTMVWKRPLVNGRST